MSELTDSPWEPALAGTDEEQVLGALHRLRTTFRWKADGLDTDGLSVRLGASALTLGGLLKHLAACEETMVTVKLRGARPGGVMSEAPEDDWDWTVTSAAQDPPERLYAWWDDAVAQAQDRVAAALAGGGLDQPVHASDGEGNHASLRRLICDLIEEYGRHTGHADLLREAVDGLVGEDPPPGWRPVSGSFDPGRAPAGMLPG